MGKKASTAAPSQQPVVAWLTPALGYGDDLQYFAPLIAGFHERFPQGFVTVSDTFPVDHYPELPLAPIMHYFDFRRKDREVGGQVYETWHRYPNPGGLLEVARRRPDVIVIIEFSHVSLGGWLLAKLLGKPVVLLVESDPSYRGAPSSSLVTKIKSFIARHSRVVLVSNDIGRAYLTDTVGVPASKIMVGPYLTSDASIATPIHAPDREGPVRLLFLNSVTERKGVAEFIRALAATPSELRSSWHLDLVGSGDQSQSIDELITELGLSDNVTSHGRVCFSETASFYERAEVVVAPTLADYRSLNGFEAVNAGRVLVTSIHDGAHIELSRFGPATIVVDPLDHEAFSQALLPLLSRTREFVALTDRALNVPTNFTVDAACDNLATAIHRSLESRSNKQ